MEENNNKKLKLTHSLPAKVGAMILLTLFASLAAVFAADVIFSLDFGWYTAAFRPIDHSAENQAIARLLYDMRYWSIGLGAASLIAAIIAFVFLCSSAGHRGYTDEVRLNHVDKIPIDLYFCAAALAVTGCLAIGFEAGGSGYYNTQASIAFLMLGCLLAGLAALAFILSFVTRVKLSGWWRNSVIYVVLRFCWKIIKRIWAWCVKTVKGIGAGLPVVWRTAIIALLALFAEFALTRMMSDGPLWAMLWFLFNLFIFSALCFGAIQMKSLKAAGEKLAAGDLSYQLDTNKMYWEFKQHGQSLNSIANGMAVAVEDRLKSERLKTELITNVSHDIKTPLTSIVSYVDLLQKEHTPEQETEYLDVLARSSQRLKKLTEDLVEASKASTGNMSVSIAPTNTAELLNQSVGEYSEKLSAGKLEAVVSMPDPPVTVLADGRLLWRVLDNLLNNVCKYALPGTRVYVDVTLEPERGVISIKNISRTPLNVSPEELMERFVRGDASRNTEGSGLGLNIAKSLMELMGGTLTLVTDGDLFKAEIRLPRAA